MSYQTSSKWSPPLSAPGSPRMVDSALDLSNIWRLVISPDALHWATGGSWELLFILPELTYISSTQTFRKQTTFRDATNGFPAKWRLRNKRRNSILMTRHYPDLGSASDWLKQISLVKSLPFRTPEAWKRYPVRAEPPGIGHHRVE